MEHFHIDQWANGIPVSAETQMRELTEMPPTSTSRWNWSLADRNLDPLIASRAKFEYIAPCHLARS